MPIMYFCMSFSCEIPTLKIITNMKRDRETIVELTSMYTLCFIKFVFLDKGTHLNGKSAIKLKVQVKVKVNVTLEKSMKDQRGSRAITILFL